MINIPDLLKSFQIFPFLCKQNKLLLNNWNLLVVTCLFWLSWEINNKLCHCHRHMFFFYSRPNICCDRYLMLVFFSLSFRKDSLSSLHRNEPHFCCLYTDHYWSYLYFLYADRYWSHLYFLYNCLHLLN